MRNVVFTHLIRLFAAAMIVCLLSSYEASAQILPTGNLLQDSGFESDAAPLQSFVRGPGNPYIPGEWNAEFADLINSPTAGITPDSADGMLRVNWLAGTVSQVNQIIDVSAFATAIDGGNVTAIFSIWVNAPGAEVDTGISFKAGPTQNPNVGTIDPVLGGITNTLLTTDLDVNSWQLIQGSHLLAPTTRFLDFEFRGWNNTIPTGGVFFDSASVTLIPEPSSLAVVLIGAAVFRRRSTGRLLSH